MSIFFFNTYDITRVYHNNNRSQTHTHTLSIVTSWTSAILIGSFDFSRDVIRYNSVQLFRCFLTFGFYILSITLITGLRRKCNRRNTFSLLPLSLVSEGNATEEKRFKMLRSNGWKGHCFHFLALGVIFANTGWIRLSVI